MNPLETLARNAKRRNMEMQCDPQWVLNLMAERDALRAAVESLRKDAERYRWIADTACDVGMSASNIDYGDGDTDFGPRVEVDPHQYQTEHYGSAKQKLDAAIDAAMGKESV